MRALYSLVRVAGAGLLGAGLMIGSALMLPACDDGDVDEAVEELQDEADDAKDKAEDFKDELEDEIDDHT